MHREFLLDHDLDKNIKYVNICLMNSKFIFSFALIILMNSNSIEAYQLDKCASDVFTATTSVPIILILSSIPLFLKPAKDFSCDHHSYTRLVCYNESLFEAARPYDNDICNGSLTPVCLASNHTILTPEKKWNANLPTAITMILAGTALLSFKITYFMRRALTHSTENAPE